MLLGFMSLILVTTQKSIAKICIPNNVAYTMLPCDKIQRLQTTEAYEIHYATSTQFEQLVFEDNMVRPNHRLLTSVNATSNSTGYCASKVLRLYKINTSIILNIYSFHY